MLRRLRRPTAADERTNTNREGIAEHDPAACGAELHRGHGGGIAACLQLRLDDDERRREDHPCQHEQVALPGAAPAGAGHQHDADE